MEAYKLQPHEAAAMAADPAIQQRILTSYKLMLDFYGIRMKDETTGAIPAHAGVVRLIPL
jgi:hypothetical protein